MLTSLVLVLLWTGTLLHDVAEDLVRDFGGGIVAAQPVDPACNATTDSEELEHFHLAGAISKLNPFLTELGNHIAAPALLPSVVRSPLALAHIESGSTQAPTSSRANNLYLTNRRLLI